MASTSHAIAPQRAPSSLRDRARALGPMIDASAAANELATELPRAVVDAMDDAGLFALAVPRELGGAEAHPNEIIDAIGEVAYWDGSTGWYLQAVVTGGAVAGAFLGDTAVAQVFRDGRFEHVAGQVAPSGKAEKVAGGYRVSGRYAFGSGSPAAQWIVGGYIPHEHGRPIVGSDGQPTILVGVAPRANVVFRGNWDVLGLRSTGSYDFEIPEQVLHEDFFFAAPTPVRHRGGALYGMGFTAIPCICHSAFAIGAARRTLAAWADFAADKLRPDGRRQNEMQTFQRDIAVATAKARAAESYVRKSFETLFDAAKTGTIDVQMKLDGRLATSHMLAVAMQIAQDAFASCTTTAARNGSVIQRCFRDIHVGNAHFLTGEQSLIEAGRFIGGVEGAQISL